MLILHRANDPNSTNVKECFTGTVGFEIDIRDSDGELVIAHDLIKKNSNHLKLQDFFEIYKKYKCNNIIALNIKACGLSKALKNLLIKFDVTNYFTFDMAVPDIIGYIQEDLNFFTRQSEYENNPSFYDQANGVWLDEFKGHWINEEIIMEHINNGKKVVIVSPELHGRKYLQEWQNYKQIIKNNNLDDNDLMICTDYPNLF